jgi:uncharacterized membrane protein
MYAVLKVIHLVAMLLWVGGMAFAHVCLRPAAAALDPPQRLVLMEATLARFFFVVAWAAPLAWISGLAMLWQARGAESMAPGWIAMAFSGSVMLLIFGHVLFAQYPPLRRAVAASEWARAGAALARIRRWVGVNLVIGLLTVVATGWR